MSVLDSVERWTSWSSEPPSAITCTCKGCACAASMLPQGFCPGQGLLANIVHGQGAMHSSLNKSKNSWLLPHVELDCLTECLGISPACRGVQACILAVPASQADLLAGVRLGS